ncbi:DUF4823 domain-containing protein [Rhodobacteraceae bacterium NNCM2]|nr:DUF4823 domain-containing protein [Coraliihabitans acroporae]
MRKFFVAALVIGGCTSTYDTNEIKSNSSELDPTRKVYISQPPNGSYGGDEYLASGEMTSNAVRSAFLRHIQRAEVLQDCSSIECDQVSSLDPDAYFAEPQILHWEDRATEWSGISDRVEIKLSIYNLDTKEQISAAMISGKSKWATMGGDHPQDLLADPINAYVNGLY